MVCETRRVCKLKMSPPVLRAYPDTCIENLHMLQNDLILIVTEDYRLNTALTNIDMAYRHV
jgi:hypothetical protein